ncbi:MAG TPA: S-adenosylmethionine decarboxylase proenzyme, partial [Syntrophomonas sp.]|nr:S-adenosylmethionine decarboxylase proenzyme [Syntrophomonas sp.]
VDPWDACKYLEIMFGAEFVNASEIKRGILQEQDERLVANI